MIQTQFGAHVKVLRSDNGKEYIESGQKNLTENELQDKVHV